MDFLNVPNTTNYPTESEPVDGTGGISSTAINPNAFVAATLQEEEPKKASSSKLILIGVISLFAVLSLGGSAYFLFSNSRQASADENTYEEVIIVATTVPQTPIPTPTHLLPTIAASPTPGLGETIMPTMPTPFVWFTEVPTPSPNPRRYSWEISFQKPSYTSAEVSNPSRPEFTGTMRTPLSNNAIICFTEDQSFFAFKKDTSTLSRLCDEFTPTPSQRTLTCYKYNPDTGIDVKATLYPYSSCNTASPPIQSGTYVMAVRAYYNCKLSGGNMSGIPATACSDSRDVFSYDLIYTQ